MKTYELIKNETVFANISKGIPCVCCDFRTGRIMDCDGMTVGALQTYISSTEAAFFKVTVVE